VRATQPLLHEKPVRESTLRDRYRASQPHTHAKKNGHGQKEP